MQTQPLISVIIPVYNVAPYLERCLDSICGQTYRNLEIICIDDGSTDRSLAILREYEQRDPRMKVIPQPNSGVSVARNSGLKVATGEWITGVDPDDYMVRDGYEMVIREADPDVDMISFGGESFADDEGDSLQFRVAERQRFIDVDRAWSGRQKMTPDMGWTMSVYFWNKLFRRSLMVEAGLNFDVEMKFDGDSCFFYQWCAHAKTVYFTAARPYRHSIRASSLTYSSDKQAYVGRCRAHLRSLRLVVAYYQKLGLEQEYREHLDKYITRKVNRMMENRPLTPEPNIWAREFDAIVRDCSLDDNSCFAHTVHRLMERFRRGRQAELFLRACQQKAATGGQGASCPPDCIHVAMPLCGETLTAGIVSLQRLKEELAPTCRACVHVLADELSAFERSILSQMETDSFKVQLLELHHELQMICLPEFSTADPHAGYFHIVLAELLPAVTRCLWMEPGIMPTQKLAALKSLDLGTAAIAAVPMREGKKRDALCQELSERQKWRRLSLKCYYVRGIMLMDLAKLRELHAAADWLDTSLMTYSAKPFPAQRALNIALSKHIIPLPEAAEAYCVYRPKFSAVELVPTPSSQHWSLWSRCYENSPLSVIPLEKATESMKKAQQERAEKERAEKERADKEHHIIINALIIRRKEIEAAYHRNALLAKLSWGKRRQHYEKKKHEAEVLLRKIRLEAARLAPLQEARQKRRSKRSAR